MFRLLLGWLAFLAPCAALAQGPGVEPSIRVAVVQGATEVRLQGSTLVCGLPNLEQGLTSAVPTPRAMIRPTEAGLLVNDQFFEGNQLICATSGLLLINGQAAASPLYVYRSAANTLIGVTELPMERYLVGVLQGELNPAWPAEALRAQVVAARSYALAQQALRQGNGAPTVYDVESGIDDQVYRAGLTADPQLRSVVATTRGEVLVVQGRPLKAYYHSCCGGTTEAAANVWGPEATQGFRAIHDPYCARSPHLRWRWVLPRHRLESLLASKGYGKQTVTGIEATRGAVGDRVAIMTIATPTGPIQLSGNQFRRLVGFEELKSTYFKLRDRHGQWVFDGRGYGHGAGLCQWGAKGMADAGKNYREILEFYYPGVAVTRWY